MKKRAKAKAPAKKPARLKTKEEQAKRVTWKRRKSYVTRMPNGFAEMDISMLRKERTHWPSGMPRTQGEVFEWEAAFLRDQLVASSFRENDTKRQLMEEREKVVVALQQRSFAVSRLAVVAHMTKGLPEEVVAGIHEVFKEALERAFSSDELDREGGSLHIQIAGREEATAFAALRAELNRLHGLLKEREELWQKLQPVVDATVQAGSLVPRTDADRCICLHWQYEHQEEPEGCIHCHCEKYVRRGGPRQAVAVQPTLVKAARALLGWSQEDLANAAGVATSTVADFERGSRTPIANNTQAIREVFEKAGIRFLPTGVVLEPVTPPSMVERVAADMGATVTDVTNMTTEDVMKIVDAAELPTKERGTPDIDCRRCGGSGVYARGIMAHDVIHCRCTDLNFDEADWEAVDSLRGGDGITREEAIARVRADKDPG